MSNLLSVFFGIVTTFSGLITSHTAWINAPGSQGIQGHTFYDSTTVTNSDYVVDSKGVQKVGEHLARGYNYITNGSQSGRVLLVDGVNRGQNYYVPCTSTGGTNAVGGYYNTCSLTHTATGSYRSLSMECANAKLSIANLSGGYMKSWTAGASKTAGSALFVAQPRGFDVKSTIGTGGLVIHFGTGARLRVPNETFVVQTSTIVPKTTGIDCKLFYEFVPTY